MTCTFFGHRDCPETIRPLLRETLVQLIEQEGIEQFFVGTQGRFDLMVYSVLCELREIYTNILINVVLAYMPSRQTENLYGKDTIYPEEIEGTPKRFAISWRNRWMLKESCFVVAYVTHSWGGAAQFIQLAERKGKRIVNLAEKITDT